MRFPINEKKTAISRLFLSLRILSIRLFSESIKTLFYTTGLVRIFLRRYFNAMPHGVLHSPSKADFFTLEYNLNPPAKL